MIDLADLHRIEKVQERQARVQKALRTDGDREPAVVFDFGRVDPRVYERGCESLVGQVALPVGVVGPLEVTYREYTEDAEGRLEETGTRRAAFPIPMATHEGGLNASLGRGIKAANRCGGVSVHLLDSSMTRGTCYVFESTEHALAFARWIEAQVGRMRAWLEDPENPLRDVEMGGIPLLSRHARLRAVRTWVVSNTCHTAFQFRTGDACGQNMTTRNTYMLHARWVLPRLHAETGIIPAHFFLEANTGGDKKSSHLYHMHGGHGRTVLASVVMTEEVLGETLGCSIEEILKIREVGGEGAALSGMIGVTVNPVNVIAGIFAATGQDLACVGTSSMGMVSAAECPAGLQCTLRLPNLEVGTVGGGTGLPHQRTWLDLMGCTGDGGADCFAQVVGAAALCLELSTGAAMAAAGSQSFFQAHLERGGMRRAPSPTPVAPGFLDRVGEDEA